jgi:hypothetical protein
MSGSLSVEFCEFASSNQLATLSTSCPVSGFFTQDSLKGMMLYYAQVSNNLSKIKDWILECPFGSSSNRVLFGNRIASKRWMVLQDDGWVFELVIVQ